MSRFTHEPDHGTESRHRKPTRATGLSRREALMTTAAGLAMAPVVTAGLAGSAAAKAPKLGLAGSPYYRGRLGNFEITTINDGAIDVPGPFPIFGQDQFEEDVAELATRNFISPKKMRISFTPVIVNTGKQVILFDTGNGDVRRGKGAGLVRSRLQAAGFTPEQIDVVVITHCHPDHIGGLIENNKPAYPNARYVIGEQEYNYWSKIKDTASGRLVQRNVVPLADKMTFLKHDGEVVPGIRAVAAFGHTPGHMAWHMESGKNRLLLWGDITNHYVASLQRPDWHVQFDMDKEMAAATRKRLLDMIATDRIIATGYHMPFPALGYVEKQDEGFRWVPASYQLEL